jgi:hypothetical protein
MLFSYHNSTDGVNYRKLGHSEVTPATRVSSFILLHHRRTRRGP